jgi:argininosuccinate lyase
VPGIVVHPQAMRRAAQQGYATATDLADYLVRKGLPFRAAHEAVGRIVRHAAARGCDLAELSLEELRGFAVQIDADVRGALTLEGAVAARDHLGGTAPAQVAAQVAWWRARLGDG